MNRHKHKSNQQQPAGNGERASTAHEKKHSAEAKADGEQTQENSRPSIKPRWTPYEWSSIVIQSVTLFVLAVYTAFNCLMWRAMDASNGTSMRVADIAQKSLILSERPWLTTSLSGGDPGALVPNAESRFAITVHNSGHTPALHAANHICTLTYSGAFRAGAAPNQTDAGDGLIAATGDLWLWAIIPGLKTDVVNKIKAGANTLTVDGRVHFVDAFDKSHWMTFCYIYREESKAHWQLCPTGNATGDE